MEYPRNIRHAPAIVGSLVSLVPLGAVGASGDAHDAHDAQQSEHTVAELSRTPVDQMGDLSAGAIPSDNVSTIGGPDPSGEWGDRLRSAANDRGVTIFTYDDGLSNYPVSDDPIFDRFQVGMQGQVNPAGGQWFDSIFWYIPTHFVEGQADQHDPGLLDPLPRWQGVTLTEDEDAGRLSADLNGDLTVSMADLGLLIGSFGTSDAPGENPADVNEDGIVDTADLGLLIRQYGQTEGPFCVYLVTDTHAIDPDGDPVDPAVIADAPVAGQIIAILNESGDAGGEGCTDCGFFRIRPEGHAAQESVYGDWTPIDPTEIDPSDIDFRAAVDDVACAGWGTERVLADARTVINVFEPACCFFGAKSPIPLFAPTPEVPVNIECDVFMTSYDAFTWFGAVSSAEDLTVTRVFMGGFTPALNPEFVKFSTRPDFLLNHFMFIGRQPDELVAQFFGTVPDPLVGNQGKEILLNEWFTLRFQLTPDSFSIWLKDSETMALTDPSPGDDGAGTPLDGTDDIENGFAKIFPLGPFGIAPGVLPGQIPTIPHPAIATSVNQFRFLYGGDPFPEELPTFSPRPIFFDNMHIDGPLAP